MLGLLLRDPLCDVVRHRDRSVCDAFNRNEGKGRLDIKFAPALVQRAGQGRAGMAVSKD